MSQRSLFWILIAVSAFVSLLFLVQVYLNHAVRQEQRKLFESQQIASSGPTYENTWKQLGARIYELSRQDPALAEVLQRQQIAIHVNKSASSANPAPAPVAPVSSTASKPSAPAPASPQPRAPATP